MTDFGPTHPCFCKTSHFMKVAPIQIRLTQRSYWKIEILPWWWCIVSETISLWQNNACQKGEPEYIGNVSWRKPTAIYVPLDQILHAGHKRWNYRRKNETASDTNTKISVVTEYELLRYWRTYNPAWLLRLSRRQTWDRLGSWLLLHFIFAMHRVTNCKSPWQSSNCSSRTGNVDDGMLTLAKGYKNVAYFKCADP